MNQSSFLNPWFWLMPNRSYAHPSYQMNFYWKFRMDCFATTFIFDEMRSFLPKETMSWKKLISLMSELRIVHLAHRVTHPLSLWGYEHSWVDLPRDKASLSMSMKFRHKDHAHPWHLHSLLCQVAVSLTIIWGLMPFWMVVFGFPYHNIYARLVVVFVH